MIKLGYTLYAHKEETVEVTGTKIGKTGIAGLSTSEHRAGMVGSPKMSCIATLFDSLIMYPGTIAVYESTIENSIYCEINKAGYIADGNKIIRQAGTADLKAKYQLIPDVLYELSRFGRNEELKECYDLIMETYEKTGVIKEQDLLLFCDSYYYGCAKDKSVLDESDILDENQIQAAFRSGSYEPHARLWSSAKKFLAKSEYEKGAAKKKSARKSSKGTDFIQECKEGKYRVPYEWGINMQRYIIKPSFLDTFESTPEFEEIVKKIAFRSNRILERMDMGLTGAEAIGKDYMNIMLLGKPGTGKTTLAYALSAATGMPVCTTAHNKHTDEDEYEGKTKIVDGKPTFVETDSLIFHENGGIDINEEINLADPSVTMGGLGQKVEYPFIVKRNGYETKVRHPLNIVIATMNVGTNGSNPLNQALANRFKTPYILDDPTSETFINILEKSSGKSREVCEWVYSAYSATVDYLKSPDVNEDEICQNLSIRTCIGAIENMEEGQTPLRALINSIVGAVAVVDLEVARRLQHEKIECLPNPKFEF